MIDFLKFSSPIHSLCEYCGNSSKIASFRVTTNDLVFNLNEIDLFGYTCTKCKSITWSEHIHIGYINDSVELNRISLEHYCLVGAGIDLGITLLNRIRNKNSKNLIEVGCGFGFNLHYWTHYLKNKSTGYEAAQYGREGVKRLGVNIHHEYIKPETIPSQKFDIVLSTEVIEHVDDPFEFLIILKNLLKDDGVLILTTPNSEFIQEGNDESLLIAVLSPGFHNFVLSELALENLIKRAGFNDYIIEKHNERLVAFVSKNSSINLLIDKKSDRKLYIDYLKYLASCDDLLVAEGALYRLFKELVNIGDYTSAKSHSIILNDLIKSKYALDINALLGPTGSDSVISNLTALLDSYPPYLGMYFYYLGILCSSEESDIENKLIYFSLAKKILHTTTKCAPQFAQEAISLLNTCNLHYQIALVDLLLNQKNLIEKQPLIYFNSEKSMVERYSEKIDLLKKGLIGA